MFSIGIPTLNRYDLLKETLDKYVVDFPGVEIHIVDNGNQYIDPPKNVTVHLMPKNMGVSWSWNFLLKTIYKKHKVAVILNDDVYWGVTKKEVFDFIKQSVIKENVGFLVSPKTWCSFLMTKKVFDQVGDFDETFYPAYWEDQDYSYRMQLLNTPTRHSLFMDPIIFRNSMTLQKDLSINNNFMKNKEYYERKWGGELGQEKFITPFGK